MGIKVKTNANIYTVRITHKPQLTLPEPLSRLLNLKDGEQVIVTAEGKIIPFKEPLPANQSGFAKLIGIFKAPSPDKKIDFNNYMTKHGYEELDGKESL